MAQAINENGPGGLKELTEQNIGEWALEHKRKVDSLVGKHRLKHVGNLCTLHLEGIDRKNTYEEALELHGLYDAIASYCCEDCNNTYKLFCIFSKKLRRIQKTWRFEYGHEQTPLEYLTKEMMPTEEMLARLELRGLKVDVEKVAKYKAELSLANAASLKALNEQCQKGIQCIEDALYEVALGKRVSEAGKAKVKRASVSYKTIFKWTSNDHLADLFYKQLGYPCTKYTATGKPSMDENVVAQLPLTPVIEEYRKLKKNQKLLSTYTGEKKGLTANLEDGKVYAEYPQKTVTGRLASRKPNMQNLPRGPRVREFFVPDAPDKAFIYFDYSQLELRIAAHLSQDPKLVAAYKEGGDLHQVTADLLGVERQDAKTINFLMIYDGSAWRLQQELPHLTVDQCQEIIDNFFRTYYQYKIYLKKQLGFMRRTGCVISEAGRVRRLPALLHEHERSKLFRHAVKQGYNFPIQSLGASITKRAMCELSDMGFDMVTQVHDSVIIQVSKDARIIENSCAIIKRVAENIYPLSVPLEVDMKVLNSMSEEDIVTKEELNVKKHDNNQAIQAGNEGYNGGLRGAI